MCVVSAHDDEHAMNTVHATMSAIMKLALSKQIYKFQVITFIFRNKRRMFRDHLGGINNSVSYAES